ncbi:MAG: hypothetical protein GY935_03905 [Gammaproteobacteria bacterium]|nr:hypothetical protein [Gammaproteobacteria bacterium]
MSTVGTARNACNLGFLAFDCFGVRMGMCICSDCHWPEIFWAIRLGCRTYRDGYNMPQHDPPAPEHGHLHDFHNHLVMQAGAYQNGSQVVGVAKVGDKETCDFIGGICIIASPGRNHGAMRNTG